MDRNWNRFRMMSLILLLVTLTLLPSRQEGPVSVASPLASVAIVEPDGVGDEIGEGDDYATTLLGDPWDMNEYSDLARESEYGWVNISLSDGIWRGITTNSDPAIWPINMGYESSQALGKMGRVYPVETAKYRRLSFRMYSSKDNDGVQLFWFTGANWIPAGVSSWIPFYDPGWHTISVDLAQLGSISGSWLGQSQVTGLRLDPISSGSGGEEIKFDWIRLTSYDAAPQYAIQWTPSVGSLDIYFDSDDADPSDAVLVVSGVDASAGSYSWGNDSEFPLASLPPGDYYIYVPGSGYSSGPLTINSAPLVQITKPSPLSGEDYATAVVGNPWDMDDPIDATIYNATNTGFAGGILTASAVNGDPNIYPRVTSPIDTHKYHWLSYSLRLPQTGTSVWNVARILWRQTDSSPWQTTDDIITWFDNGNGYTTWYTYTMDLRQLVLEPGSEEGWTGQQRILRIDPHESPIPPFFSIDWVKLTADDQADTSFNIAWSVSDRDVDDSFTINLYHDSDTIWENGRTFIAQMTPGGGGSPSPPAGPHVLYMPLILKDCDPTSHQYLYAWDTSGVVSGAYWLWVEVTDGYNTTRWVSETPLMISH